MKLYIAYGSNTNHKLMASRCPDAQFITKTVIKGYHVEIHGTENNALLTIVPDKNSEVEAAVWRISDADEAALDNYAKKLYQKEIFDIIINRTPKKAIIYIMNDGEGKAVPNKLYFDCVLDGYLKCKIHEDQLFEAMIDANK